MAEDKKKIYKDFNEEQEVPKTEIPDLNDFDEEAIFARLTTDENIFNSRGLSHAPKHSDTPRDRYCQMGCCAQMHSCQWTDLFPKMSAESDFPIVQVRFKNTHKDFFRLPEKENPKDYLTGDIVVTESANGHDTGIICLKGELVRLQMKKLNVNPESTDIRKIVRKARPNDVDKWTETIQAEKEMQRRARVIAAQLGLSMKINSVEIQGDFTKAIFYYTADDRVDFRQLIKVYAEEFKLRIEMRQIGARQESGILGGVGSCGRELCCVTFLHNFASVSTHAARVQQISLNPQKLAGQCSKLKCCLNYEYDVYTDALKNMPDSGALLRTESGEAKCIKTDPLKRTLTYIYPDAPNNYIELSADRVAEILERNKRGETVGDLNGFVARKAAPAEPVTEFQQVVGQDELTRFDKPKKGRDRDKRDDRDSRDSRNKRDERNNDRQNRGRTLEKPKLKDKQERQDRQEPKPAPTLSKPILKKNPQENE